MSKLKSVTTDPRYRDLVIRFRYDWVGAIEYLFGVMPTMHQEELLEASEDTGARVSVSSGHGTGKSFMISMVCILYMILFPQARVVLVANKIDQIKIGVWKNVKANWKLIGDRHPWIAKYFVLTEETFYEATSKGQWFTSFKSCRQGNEEALAGEHAKHLLWIVDEASGISDKAFGFITGSLTETDNRMVLLSQPTRSNGYFYNTHHELQKTGPDDRTGFTALVFNSEDSELVDLDFIRAKLREYGGRDNPEYCIKVRGIFPESLEGFLLSRAECEKATKATPELAEDWGWVALADVGNGRDSSVLLIGKVSGERYERRFIPERIIEKKGNMDPVSFGRFIATEANEEKYPNITVCIDADGVGAATCKIAEEKGVNVQRIRWGFPMFSDEDKSRFLNKRAFASIMARDAVLEGRMQLDSDKKTIKQGSSLPYGLNERGVNYMMPKKEMKEKHNISSPDRFDCYCFVFLADYLPANMIVTDEMKIERKQAGVWANDLLEDWDEV